MVVSLFTTLLVIHTLCREIFAFSRFARLIYFCPLFTLLHLPAIFDFWFFVF